MATKSLILRVEIDLALKAHNCQANPRHRITKGDIRLKVRNKRSWVHYCRTCAETMIAKDISKLTELMKLEQPSVI